MLAKIQKELPLTRVQTYDSHIRRFNRWAIDGRHGITPDSIKLYLKTARTASGIRYASASLANIRAALKHSLKSGSTDIRILAALDSAFKSIKAPKVDRKVYAEEILTDEQIETMIDAAPPRIAPIVQTLTLTGLRISELTGIRLADCKREGKNVFIKITGKGGKERRVFLPASLYEEIRELYKGREFLFESIHGNRMSRAILYREIRELGQKAIGSPYVHPHTFRHTFATKYIKKRGGSTKAVSLYLGHSSTAITESMYLHDQITPEDIFG